jgi:ribose-phosphate pyrophosphokinase
MIHVSPPLKQYASGEWFVCWQHPTWQTLACDLAGVVVIHSVYPDTGESMVSLDMLVRALHHRGHRVTVILPFIPYGRQDKPDQTPNGWGTMARWLGFLPIQRLITLDPHAPTMTSTSCLVQRFPVTTLSHAALLTPAIPPNLGDVQGFLAPDQGSANRAKDLALWADKPWIILKKSRDAAGDVHQMQWHSGSLDTRLPSGHWWVVDDMLDTGSTLKHSVQWLKHHGANRISALITHGLLSCHEGLDHLRASGLDQLWLTTSIAPPCGVLGSDPSDQTSHDQSHGAFLHWQPWAETLWETMATHHSEEA